MKITICIPTANRAAMLRTALMSVANQSRADLIHEVIVSENGGDRSSEAVCKEFPTLVIRYLFQDPPVHPAVHFNRIVEAGSDGWIALLGDDDMWGRYHLEEAYRALSSNEDAIGFVGQAVIVRNESRQVASRYTELMQSLMNPTSQTFLPYWRWSAVDMLTEALAVTPLNLWALVARKAAILEGFQILREYPMGADADRFFWWALSRQGMLLIGREVSLFYRVHESSACAGLLNSAPKFHEKKASDYSIKMIKEAEEDGMDWRQAWLESWNKLNASEQARIWKGGINGAKSVLRDKLKGMCSFPDPKIKSPIAKLFVRLIPPIITDALRRFLV